MSNNDRGPQIRLPFEINKDRLALVLGGIIVLSFVFATYNYFNKSAEISSSSTEREADGDVTVDLDKKIADEKSNETSKTGSTTTNNSKGGATLGTNNTGTTTNSATLGTSTSKTAFPDSNSTWTANDYKNGDIKGASYTVKNGDTLWEIAEATYGDGHQWTKILAANKGSIGFLANGSQALITPGQVLILP